VFDFTGAVTGIAAISIAAFDVVIELDAEDATDDPVPLFAVTVKV
jgi:hypothetical protein